MKKAFLLLALPLFLIGCSSKANANECSIKETTQDSKDAGSNEESFSISGKTYYLLDAVLNNTLNRKHSNAFIFGDSSFEYIADYQWLDFLNGSGTYNYKIVENEIFSTFNDGETEWLSHIGEIKHNGEVFKTYQHTFFVTETFLTKLGVTII